MLPSRILHGTDADLRRRLPGEQVGAAGMSLSAATALPASGPSRVDALALGPVYPDMEAAHANRLRRHRLCHLRHPETDDVERALVSAAKAVNAGKFFLKMTSPGNEVTT